MANQILTKQPSEWLDMKQAIEYTELGDTTLRNAFYSKRLRGSRITGKVMFRRLWLDKFMIYGKQRLNGKEKADFQQELLDVEIFNGAIRKAIKDIEDMPVFPITETTQRIENLERRVELLVEERDKVLEERRHE